MGQVKFQTFGFGYPWGQKAGSNGTMSFVPINIYESVSLGAINIAGALANTVTLSFGLYSLNNGTLSLANSGAGTKSGAVASLGNWFSISTFSATSNLTPGTWWLGLLFSTGGNTTFSLRIYRAIQGFPTGSFPGGFIAGRMTDSTNALPGAYATSDLDISGGDALALPDIIISS